MNKYRAGLPAYVQDTSKKYPKRAKRPCLRCRTLTRDPQGLCAVCAGESRAGYTMASIRREMNS
jgi:hypothetical protein